MKRSRRLLSIVIAAMMMICPVFANDGYVYENSGEDFLCDTEVSYQAYSSFYVTIPTSIGLNESGRITATTGNLEEGRHIAVYATNLDESGKLDVTNQYGDSAKLLVFSGNEIVGSTGFITSFYPGGGLTEGSTIFSVDTDGSGMKPGLYSGIIAFRVCLEND